MVTLWSMFNPKSDLLGGYSLDWLWYETGLGSYSFRGYFPRDSDGLDSLSRLNEK